MDLNSSILTDSINDFVPITSNINSSVSSQIDSAVDLDIQQQKQTSKNNVVASSFKTPIESLNQISSVLISDGHSLNTANSLPVIKPNHQISNAPSKSVASNIIDFLWKSFSKLNDTKRTQSLTNSNQTVLSEVAKKKSLSISDLNIYSLTENKNEIENDSINDSVFSFTNSDSNMNFSNVLIDQSLLSDTPSK